MSDMPFDPSPYRQDLDGIDLPVHEIDRMIIELRARLDAFINRAHGHGPMQLACEKNAEKLGGTDAEHVILHRISAKQLTIFTAPMTGRAKEDSKET